MLKVFASDVLGGGSAGRGDALAVASRLLSCSTLVQHAGNAETTALVPFADHAFHLLSTSERAVGYHLLALLMTYGYKDGRAGAIFDRMPSLITSVCTREEGEALHHLLYTVLDLGAEDLMGFLNKAISKIVNSSCRVASRKDEFSAFALSIVQTIAQSRSRALLSSSNSVIKQSCAELLEEPSLAGPAALLLASLASSENPANWSSTWFGLSLDCADLLQNKLGVHVGINVSGSHPSSSSSSSSSSSTIASLTGCRKALAVETAFKSKCLVMVQMLAVGCASGPIQLDLSSFVPVLHAVLSMTFNLSSQDPRSNIANDQDVCPADICLISSQLKLHILAVLTQLLKAKHPSLLRLASSLSRPLLALLAGPEIRTAFSSSLLQPLLLSTLEAVRMAIRCFPTLVASGNATGIQALTDLFCSETAVMCSLKGTVGQIYGTEEEAAATDTRPASLSSEALLEKWTALMDTIEALLLFAGPLLPQQIRHIIESAIGQLLATMTKGLLSKHGSEKKTRRSACEVIRQAQGLQNIVLRMALCDVLSAQRSGIVSGNAALLREALEPCLHQPETCSQAMHCLLAIEALLRPTAVALPSLNATASAGEYLRAVQQNSIAPSVAVTAYSSLVSAPSAADDVLEVGRAREEGKRGGKGIDSADGGPASSKRQRTDSKVTASATVPAAAAAAPIRPQTESVVATASAMPALPTRAPTSQVQTASNMGDDDEDDEDLPDMDVDTRPDEAF